VSKLSNRDIARIIKQFLDGKSVRKIADFLQVTRQRIYQLIHRFLDTETIPVQNKPGRKSQEIDDGTENLVLQLYDSFDLGPVLLEKKIEEVVGVHIPHNTIYRILLRNDLIEENMKKKKQRKWVRFEREHAMSLWQGDWKQLTVNGRKIWLIAFMDDASRLITCYGTFDAPTIESVITVLEKGFREYGTPEEILTDHGTQFVASRNRDEARHTFKEFLEMKGIRHIVAGISHPQTNGKIERFFGEVERRIPKFGSMERMVHWHNVIKPHMSLDYDEPCNVFWYRLAPERILGYAMGWWK